VTLRQESVEISSETPPNPTFRFIGKQKVTYRPRRVSSASAKAENRLASLFARPSLKDVIAPLDQTECTHPTGDLAHIGATLEGASAAPLPRTAINGGDCCPCPKLGHTATPPRGRYLLMQLIIE